MSAIPEPDKPVVAGTSDNIDGAKKGIEKTELRQKEYNFTLKNGDKLLVTSDKNSDSYYESFKLFINDREIAVTSVVRYRDGGATYIETAE